MSSPQINIDPKKYLADMIDDYYSNKNDSQSSKNNIKKIIHKQLLHPNLNKNSGIAVSGYYFIYHQTGPWFKDALKYVGKPELNFPYIDSSFTEQYTNEMWGALAKNINIPELFFDYDNISGRSKNLTTASKQSYNGDFSITYVDNNHFDIMTYHDLWLKYMKHLRKGSFKAPESHNLKYHYEVPYHNAVFVLIFDPMMNIKMVSKIMGVTPISLPLKDYVGTREKPEIIKPSINYKSVDMYYDIFHKNNGIYQSEVFEEFVNAFET